MPTFVSSDVILVADDDPVTARFLASLFRAEGFEVVVADDGEAALVAAVQHGPAAIVGSLALPHPSGGDVLHAVRREASLDEVPVVVVSLRDSEDEIVLCLNAGADDYVVKPFNPRELVARVRKRLRSAPPP